MDTYKLLCVLCSLGLIACMKNKGEGSNSQPKRPPKASKGSAGTPRRGGSHNIAGSGSCSRRSSSGVGCPGLPGPSGPTGQQGIQGIQGVQGVQGTGGVPGTQGYPGTKGEKGRRGFKGEKGDSGPGSSSPDHVAFSVTIDGDLPMSDEYRVIQFNVILTNIGGAYDEDSSIFTAPINGTYMVGFGGVSYHGQNILLHLVKNGQRVLSAFDNSGCSCCKGADEKCAGSGSNAGVLSLDEEDKIWLIMPDQHGMHNAHYHNYASFYGYLIFSHKPTKQT